LPFRGGSSVKKIYALVLLLLLTAVNVSWARDIQRNILVIHSYHQALPWTVSFQEGLNRAREQRGNTVEYYTEYMDAVRLRSPLRGEAFVQYLEYKYRAVSFDAVICDSDSACKFIHQYGDFLGDIPRVFYTGERLSRDANTCNLVMQYEKAVQDTFRIAMEQNPEALEIVVILDQEGSYDYIKEILQPILSQYEDLSLRSLRYTSFEGLRNEIGRLGRDSIVIFNPVIVESGDRRYIPRELLSELTSVSRTPFYTLWSSLMGTGAVGGYMIDGAMTAEVMVQAVLDFYENGAFNQTYSNLRYIFDWKVMEKYGLDPLNVPEESVFLNQPQNIFVTHTKEVFLGIIFTIALFLAVSTLLLFIVWRKNRQLREANVKIREAQKIAEDLARQEPLTELLNRRGLMPFIHYEMNRKKRMDRPVSLMLLDIDNFKDINDTCGHETGDTVLKELADAMSRSSRETDIIARWGGDEFLVLVSETSGRNTVVLADKFRKEIMRLHFPNCRDITVSIGVAEHVSRESFTEWYNRADQALYKAKTGGRNAVVLA